MTRLRTLTAPALPQLWLAFSLLLLALLATPLRASEVLLTLTLPDRTITFDRAALEALPVAEFETTTIWTEGPQKFRGVRMRVLLDQYGVTSGMLQLTAVNDYAIEIDAGSFRADGAILAYDRNGEAMTLRTKGPLWLVYPYDSSPDFRSELIYSNSIWQLDRIRVE